MLTKISPSNRLSSVCESLHCAPGALHDFSALFADELDQGLSLSAPVRGASLRVGLHADWPNSHGRIEALLLGMVEGPHPYLPLVESLAAAHGPSCILAAHVGRTGLDALEACFPCDLAPMEALAPLWDASDALTLLPLLPPPSPRVSVVEVELGARSYLRLVSAQSWDAASLENWLESMSAHPRTAQRSLQTAATLTQGLLRIEDLLRVALVLQVPLDGGEATMRLRLDEVPAPLGMRALLSGQTAWVDDRVRALAGTRPGARRSLHGVELPLFTDDAAARIAYRE